MYAIQPVMNTQRMINRVRSEPWFKNRVSPNSVQSKNMAKSQNGQVSINIESEKKDPEVVSPLEAISGLLRVYCIIGIIPGRLNVDCCSITTKCWLNIKIFVVLASLAFLHIWAESDLGGTKEQTNLYRELKDTRTDEAVKQMYWALAGFFFISSVVVNHRNLGQAYRVATMLAQPGMARFDSPRSILTHHAVYIFLFGARTIAEHLDLILAGYTLHDADAFDIKVGWFMLG